MPRVLVVEDDVANAEIIELVLSRRGGFDVVVTEEVDEILRLAADHAVDAILMDVALRNSVHNGRPVDGIEITQLLKGDSETADIPIVLATASIEKLEREDRWRESRADACVLKPLDFAKLITELRELASGRASADAGERDRR